MKRSEFYAMMIIVIIMCSMSTVFAVSYQPQIIQPTKPMQTNFLQVSAATGTYYTALNIVGSGTCGYISVVAPDGNANYDGLFLKITVDGNVTEINPNNTLFNTSGEYTMYNTTSVGNNRSIVYKNLCYFKTSLKVEIKQTSTANANLVSTINYALE